MYGIRNLSFFFFNGFDYFPKQIRCIWIIDLSDMLELNPNTVLVDGWYSYLFQKNISENEASELLCKGVVNCLMSSKKIHQQKEGINYKIQKKFLFFVSYLDFLLYLVLCLNGT